MKRSILAVAMTLGLGLVVEAQSTPNVVAASSRQWFDASVGGRTVKVWGWNEGGVIRFYEAENPHLRSVPDLEPKPFPSPVKPLDGAPAKVGAMPTTKAGPVRNYGLDLGKTFTDPSDTYHASSARGRAFVAQARGGSRFDDDSGKPFLTAIGDPAKTSAIAHDLAPGGPLASIAGDVHFQALKPDDWAVTSVGLPNHGDPTILLQRPDGTVLYRQDDYAGGGEALAPRIAGKIRKPNPGYDPKADPGPSSPQELLTPALIVGAGLVLWLVLRKPRP